MDQFEDSEEKSASAAQTQDAMDVLKARKSEYEQLQKRLSASDETQICLTDLHARSLGQAR